MDCVNHPGVPATAYCQNCGKAMCAACTRQQAGGQILCEPCSLAWQNVRAPFAAPPPGVPNPGVAAVLGFIPGVGAMYNGQFVKGFIHVAIFAVLVSITSSVHSNLDVFFALLIPAWILYQVFEAYHTAKARLHGEPLPDPLGINEVAGWFHTGMQAEFRRGPGFPPHVGTPPAAGPTPVAGTAGAPPPQAGYAPPAAPPYQAPYTNPYQSGYQPPPFTGVPPVAGFTGYPPPPPAGFGPGYPPAGGYGPPVAPPRWRRPEPIAAIVLIGLGLLFLLGQMDWFSGRMFEFAWPLLLIGLGAWLLVRRMNDVRPLPGPPAPPPPENPEASRHDRDSQGGSL